MCHVHVVFLHILFHFALTCILSCTCVHACLVWTWLSPPVTHFLLVVFTACISHHIVPLLFLCLFFFLPFLMCCSQIFSVFNYEEKVVLFVYRFVSVSVLCFFWADYVLVDFLLFFISTIESLRDVVVKPAVRQWSPVFMILNGAFTLVQQRMVL